MPWPKFVLRETPLAQISLDAPHDSRLSGDVDVPNANGKCDVGQSRPQQRRVTGQ